MLLNIENAFIIKPIKNAEKKSLISPPNKAENPAAPKAEKNKVVLVPYLELLSISFNALFTSATVICC
ncbi:hypothetical protein D3C80_2106480 [compost metagenome]